MVVSQRHRIISLVNTFRTCHPTSEACGVTDLVKVATHRHIDNDEKKRYMLCCVMLDVYYVESVDSLGVSTPPSD